jgi:hypothetical protein
MAALGQLVVSLTAETAQFRQSMDRAAYQAQKNFKDITGAAKFVGGALGVAFSVGGIVAYTKSLIDTANQIQDVADRAGIAAEELSRIGTAAKLNASSQEEANDAIVKLSKSIAQAATGSKAQEDAFKKLGVSIRDSSGNIRSTTDIFYDLADGFAATEDGAGKVQVAQDLLGRSGANLIPLFNQGAKALKEYNAQFDAKFLQNSAEFNNNIDQLTTNFSRLAAELLGPVLSGLNAVFGTPVGKDLDAAIAKTKEQIENLQAAIAGAEYGGLKGIFRSGKESAEILKKELFLAEAQLLRFNTAKEASNKKTTNTISLAKEDDSAQKKVLSTIENLRSEYQALFLTKEQMLVLDAKALGANKSQIAQITLLGEAINKENSSREAQKDIIDQAIARADAWKNLVAETSTPVQILAEREAELLRLRRELIDNGYSVEEVEKRIAAAREKGQMDLLVQQQAARESLYAGLLTEEEAVMQSFANRKAAILTATEITELERQDLMRRLEEQFQKEQQERQNATVSGILQGGEQLFNGLAGFAKAAGGESSKAYRIMFAASKAFAIADATIKLQQAIANASVSAPFPANLGAMAAIAAQVSGLISTISSTNYSGAYDKGGYIPYGKWGIVGEYGPEMVQGPANVTSRKDTAEMMGRAPELNIKNINVLDPTIVGDYLNTAQGERIILNVIQRNRGALA